LLAFLPEATLRSGFKANGGSMAGENFRIERDSMGEVKVPSEAYYGAQT
jgi:hypothetical protein